MRGLFLARYQCRTLALAACCMVVVGCGGSDSGGGGAIPGGGSSSTSSSSSGGGGSATLTVSDGPIYDYGNVVQTLTAEKTFTVTHSGTGSATSMGGSGLAAPYAFKGGSYPGAGGDCAASLASGTCTVVVTFNPASSGVQNDTLVIDYDGGSGMTTAERDVTGTGLAPAILTISDGPTYDYGNVVQTLTVEKSFTVTHSGGAAATSMGGSGLVAPYAFKGGSYPGTGGDCSASLASGTCTIVVTYNPASGGAHNDTIIVDYDDGTGMVAANRAVTGTGVTAANISISDGPTFDYGNVSIVGSAQKTFTLNNGGGAPATAIADGLGLAMPYYFPAGFPGTGGTCGATLAPASNCTIVATFAPPTAIVYNDTIIVNYHDGLAATSASRAITGTGASLANLTISDGPTYDYGTREISSVTEKHFIVENTGGVNATAVAGAALTAPMQFKGAAFPGTGGTCGATINASATCTVVVEFNPTGAGNFSDTFQINYNDGNSAVNTSIGLAGAATTLFAEANTVTTPLDTAIAVNLVATGGATGYTVVSDPDSGVLSGTAPNLTYTPNSGFQGVDYFTFEADDGAVTSNVATVRIFVSPKALFVVVNKVTLQGADANVKTRLENLGFVVTLEDENNDDPADAYGQDVIVVSSTVLSGNVGTTFSLSQIPFWTWENYLWDDMNMTTGSSYGNTANTTQCNIVDDTHPTAAGNPLGATTFLTGVEGLRYVNDTVLNANAQIIATEVGQPSRVTKFSFESQVDMGNGAIAPARRLGGDGYQDGTFDLLDANGLAMFDANIDWLMSGVISQFEDHFQRADGAALGASDIGGTWSELESSSTASISGRKLVFDPINDSNRPMVRNSFSRQSSGIVSATFYFDWARSGADTDYEVWIQLGQGDLMVDNSPEDAGVAVNLKWGSPSNGLTNHEGFGYVVNAATTEITTVSGGRKKVRVTVDLGANTYDVDVDGTSVTGVALENNVDIDTIRIFADGVEGADFSARAIDNIRVFQGQ